MSASKIALFGRNTIIRESLKGILSHDYQVIHSGPLTDIVSHEVDASITLVLIIADECESATFDRVRHHFPGARMVVLTSHYDFQKLRTAFHLGVSGYLLKQICPQRLIGSLRLVAMGEKVFPSELADELTGTPIDADDDSAATLFSAHLSGRELEILRYLHMGVSNKTISRELSISEATVKVHVKAVLRKLNVTNRTQAAIWAVKHELA